MSRNAEPNLPDSRLSVQHGDKPCVRASSAAGHDSLHTGPPCSHLKDGFGYNPVIPLSQYFPSRTRASADLAGREGWRV
jgi:hypothetical protein